MNEGSSDNHASDANGNVTATCTRDGDDARDDDAMATTLEGDQSAGHVNAVHDESQNVGSTGYQRSMDVDGEMEPDNSLMSLNPQDVKCNVSTGHSMQPGAFAMSGRNEGNNSSSSGQEDVMSNRKEPQDEAIKPAATVVMGLDQEDSQGLIKGDDLVDIRPDSGVANVDPAEDAEKDITSSALIVAELVMPPIEAVRVAIDEEPSTLFTMNPMYPLELEHSPSRETTDGTRSKKFGPIFWVLLCLLVVIVLCATLIPYTLRMNDDTSNGSPSAAPSYPYACYTSLLDIFLAQISDDTLNAPTYIICPSTKISVGSMNNPSANDFRYVNGDYPIMIARENVTIQCGRDGRRENSCIIDGGFIQVLTLQELPVPDGSLYNINRTNDNLLVRGITFTGVQINSGPFSGRSVSLSHPGRNMRFEDCLWDNVTALSGLIGVSRNYYQELVGLPLEDLSIEVTFADCIFQGIVYDSPLVFVRGQSITLERCLFRDIKLSDLVQDFCRYKAGDTGQVVETERGCATLMHCASPSYCSMKDVCVDGLEIQGDGIVVINDDTIFNREGLYVNASNTTCELATISALDWTNITCSQIFDEPSCPL